MGKTGMRECMEDHLCSQSALRSRMHATTAWRIQKVGVARKITFNVNNNNNNSFMMCTPKDWWYPVPTALIN